MAFPYLSDKSFLIGMVEAEPGVEETPTSTDFNCRIRNINITRKIDPDGESEKFATGDHGRDQSIMGGRTAEIAFSLKLAVEKDGSTIQEPTYAKYLLAMGHTQEDYSNGFGYFDDPAADVVTMTLYYYEIMAGPDPSAILYVFKGCHGSASAISAENTRPWMLEAKFTGTFVRTEEIAYASIPVLTDPDTARPVRALSNYLVLDYFDAAGGSSSTSTSASSGPTSSTSLKCANFRLEMGGKVSPIEDMSDSTGVDYYLTTERDPKFTCDPMQKSIAEEDMFTNVNNEQLATLTVTSSLTSPDLSLRMPTTQLLYPGHAVREGKIVHNRTYRILRNDLGDGAADTDLDVGVSYEILFGARS